jgi:L-asparaginase
MERIRTLLVSTGGTVDKDYPRLHSGYAFEFGEPAVGRILADVQLDSECEVAMPFQKDSTEITEEDRTVLLATIIRAPQSRIVVTHGTDTLIDSAAVLGKSTELAALGKTIIVTGAMRPERFTNSDAKFNVGVAFGALECAVPGVYVAMCGRVRKWDAVERCFETGKFVDIGCAKPPAAK